MKIFTRLMFSATALMLTQLMATSPALARSIPEVCEAPAEELTNDYSVTLNYTFQYQTCLHGPSKAVTSVYVYDRYVADLPANLLRTWTHEIADRSGVKIGFSERDFIDSVTYTDEDDLDRYGYYFSTFIDVDGDGEICTGDLSPDYNYYSPTFAESSEKKINVTVPMNAVQNRPCEDLSTAELLPRDLDGNLATAEAYYDTLQNITWLADANLAKSQTFGLSRGDPASGGFEYDITSSGLMNAEVAVKFISGMNNAEWLLGKSNVDRAGFFGEQILQWRLPKTVHGDTRCSDYSPDTPYFDLSEGQGCVSELGNLYRLKALGVWAGDIENDGNYSDAWAWLHNVPADFRANYWSGSTALPTNPRTGERYVFDISSGVQSLSTTAGRYGPLFRVWPVFDGDIGNQVQVTTAVCVDSDGDGWGWDGTKSCKLQTAIVDDECDYSKAIQHDGWGWNTATSQSCPPKIDASGASTCVDSDGDGWGWDGLKSCRVDTADNAEEVEVTECVDTTPFDDDWGWDGTRSCRLLAQ